jgi:hypothetical protein
MINYVVANIGETRHDALFLDGGEFLAAFYDGFPVGVAISTKKFHIN